MPQKQHHALIESHSFFLPLRISKFQYYLNLQTTQSTLYSGATGTIDITCNAGNPCIYDLFIGAKDMGGSDIQIECSVNDACKHLSIHSAKDVTLD